jgi:hypothetical protein
MHVGSVKFPGISSIVSANMSFTHGVTPSVAMLAISPRQGFVALIGDLVFGYDDIKVTFKQCKVDTSSFIRNSSGQVWQLAVLDRRWKWTTAAGGRISGHYNRKQPDGKAVKEQSKTPRELATLCLRAMGEKSFDVKDLPNDARPEVLWDYDLPAEMLAQLCDDLGCRVVLQFDDKVVIRRVSVGADLPIGGTILDDSIAFDLPEAPDKITVVAGHTLYQADFPLEAIGQETDGTIKPVDQLSYKPVGGWTVVDFPDMNSVTGNDGKNRELAKKTVFRWYRIAVQFPNQVIIPGYKGKDGHGIGLINKLDQILPIEKEQVATKIENGVAVRLPARISGVWWRGLNSEFINTQPKTDPTPVDDENNKAIVDKGFAIDTVRGIVKFSKPIYRNSTPTSAEVTVAEAKLRLRTAVSVRHQVDWDWDRYERGRELGKLGTPTRYTQKSEVVLTYEPAYGQAYNVLGVVDNKKEIDPIIDLFLDGIERTFEVKQPETKSYPGIKTTDLDGAIQQVIFKVTTRGTTTKLARNNEIIDAAVQTIPYKQRRAIERNRTIQSKFRNETVALVRRNNTPTEEG